MGQLLPRMSCELDLGKHNKRVLELFVLAILSRSADIDMQLLPLITHVRRLVVAEDLVSFRFLPPLVSGQSNWRIATHLFGHA